MIVHLADYAAEYTGNFIYSLIDLSKEIYKNYNKLTLIIFPKEAKEKKWISILDKNNIYTAFVDMSKSKHERIVCIKNIIDNTQSKPSIIHTHFARFEMDSIILKKHYKSKLVWHMHMGYPRDNYKYKIYDLYKVKYLVNKYVDVVIPVSEYVKKLMLKRGCRESKINVVLNCIYIDKHIINEDIRFDMRNKFNIKSNEKVALMFGYSIYTKGTDILVNAINNTEENVKFVFVGRKHMEEFIHNQPEYGKYKNRIIIITHGENVEELFNMADMFIASSRIEGFSYAIGEAMLYKIPVIISDIDANSFYTTAGNGIKVFKNENSKDLANNINNILLKSLDECRSIGNSNREFIINNLNLNKWTKQIENIYLNVDKEKLLRRII